MFILLTLVASPLGACDGTSHASTEPRADVPSRPLAVRVARSRVGPLVRDARYLGTVRSVRSATVLARTGGTLLELPFPEGHRVEAGEVVARLGTPDAVARTQRARAEVSRARIERDYLCKRARKDTTLEQAGALTGAAADLGRKRCASARAAVKASEAQVRELGVVEARAAESAPIDGLVLEWLAEPGENVMPGRPLVRIGGAAMEVVVALTEADLARGVAVGTPAAVSVRGGPPVATEIVSLAPLARGPGRTVEAALRLPGSLAQGAYAGMALDVAVTLERLEDAVSVPSDALLHDDDGAAIFVVARDGRIARARVTPGLVAGGWTAVAPAPAADSRVVLGPPRGLEDGQQVYAVDAPEVRP